MIDKKKRRREEEKKKQCGWSLRESSLNAFREAVIRVEGQKYEKFGDHASNALDSYTDHLLNNHLKHPQLVDAHTHKTFSAKSQTVAKNVMSFLCSELPGGYTTCDGDGLARAIVHQAGGDPRTLKRWKTDLVTLGYLEVSEVKNGGATIIYNVLKKEEDS